jgi:Tfp pilus assembly PilM family ATPase/HAMP domain-containing protein
MPRYLAIEWNADEAHVLVAAAKGDRAVVEHAFAVTFSHAEGEDADKAALGQQIAAALQDQGIGRVEALIAIGRTNIELRQLTLPPAPDDELPDMVRIQAMREFHSLEEDWLLDYIPLEDRADQPRVVLAAAVDPGQVAQVQQVCEAAGIKPHRLVLGPCATASLLNRQQPEQASRVRLLVDLANDEADLTVIADRKVIFLRTARVPGSPLCDAEAAQVLLGEIRRTMAAVQNQPGGRPIEAIVLCGTGAAEESLCRSIQSALQLPTDLFDPFSAVELGGDLGRALSDTRARFAPLLGMVVDEVTRTPPAIDFLNPRRRPQPPNRRRQYLLAAGAVAALVVLWFGWSWLERSSLQNEIQDLTRQLKTQDAKADRAEKIEQMAVEVGKWTGADVIWLDELHGLCRDFPPAQDAMLTQVTAESTTVRGSRIELQGLVRSAGALDDLEQRLRTGTHRVEGEGRTLDSSKKGYTYRFKSTVLLEKSDEAKRLEKEGAKRAEKPAPQRSEKPGELP